MATPGQTTSNTRSGILDQLGQGIQNAINAVSNSGILNAFHLQPNVPPDPPESNKNNPEGIIGLPPSIYYNARDLSQTLRSMPIVEITPGWPHMDSGLNIFKFDGGKGQQKYTNALSPLGITPKFPIKIAFNNDSQIVDSFSNQYSESEVQSMANMMTNQKLASARYMSGSSGIGDTIGELGGYANRTVANNWAGTKGGKAAGQVGALVEAGGRGAGKFASGAENAASNLTGKNGNAAIKIVSGSKIDFPQVWRATSYSPSYSINIKLYNPFPNSEVHYYKHIIEPIALLLAFMTPLSDSDYTFEYPVLCKATCPGLFQIDAGYIEQMTIIKGGGNGDISFAQRPGLVEVSLTFASLYSSMIAKVSGTVNEDRPTLDKYIQTLRGKVAYPEIDLSEDLALVNGGSVVTQSIPNDQKIQATAINVPELNTFNITSTDPINRVSINDQEAFLDPTINGYITNSALSGSQVTASTEDVAKQDRYIRLLNYYTTLTVNNQLFIPKVNTEHRVAIAIRAGLTLPTVLSNWFWQNFDTFDPSVSDILYSDATLASQETGLITEETY